MLFPFGDIWWRWKSSNVAWKYVKKLIFLQPPLLAPVLQMPFGLMGRVGIDSIQCAAPAYLKFLRP